MSLGIRPAGSSGVHVDNLTLRSLVDTTPDPSWILHHHTFTRSTFLIISLFCYYSLFLLHTGISGRQPDGYEMSTLHICNIYIYIYIYILNCIYVHMNVMLNVVTVPNQDNRNSCYGYQIMVAARWVRVETCCFLLIYQLTIE